MKRTTHRRWLPRFGMVAAVLAVCFVTPAVASAHVLRTDAGMGVELHLPPNDAPIARTPVTYQLTFDETEGSFEVQNCSCAIEFIGNGNPIARQTLVAESSTVASGTYTFASPGNYTFRVTGAPKAGAAFAPFTVDYPVRIGINASSKQALPPLAWIAIGAGAGLLVLVALIQGLRSKRSKQSTEQPSDE